MSRVNYRYHTAYITISQNPGGEAAINIYERGLQAVNSLELYMHYCQLMSDMAGPPNQQLTVGSSGGDVFMQEPSEGECILSHKTYILVPVRGLATCILLTSMRH